MVEVQARRDNPEPTAEKPISPLHLPERD